MNPDDGWAVSLASRVFWADQRAGFYAAALCLCEAQRLIDDPTYPRDIAPAVAAWAQGLGPAVDQHSLYWLEAYRTPDNPVAGLVRGYVRELARATTFENQDSAHLAVRRAVAGTTDAFVLHHAVLHHAPADLDPEAESERSQLREHLRTLNERWNHETYKLIARARWPLTALTLEQLHGAPPGLQVAWDLVSQVPRWESERTLSLADLDVAYNRWGPAGLRPAILRWDDPVYRAVMERTPPHLVEEVQRIVAMEESR